MLRAMGDKNYLLLRTCSIYIILWLRTVPCFITTFFVVIKLAAICYICRGQVQISSIYLLTNIILLWPNMFKISGVESCNCTFNFNIIYIFEFALINFKRIWSKHSLHWITIYHQTYIALNHKFILTNKLLSFIYLYIIMMTLNAF